MQLTHLHVYCRELDPALTFMVEGLKGTLIGKRLMMGCPGAEIRFGETVIFLKEVGASWAEPDVSAHICGYSHIGFFVEDLDATMANLLAMPDVRLDGEPFVLKERKRRCVYLTGPSSLYVELIEELKEGAK